MRGLNNMRSQAQQQQHRCQQQAALASRPIGPQRIRPWGAAPARSQHAPLQQMVQSAASTAQAASQTPRNSKNTPPEPETLVAVDSETVYDLAPNVQVIRGSCLNKLRMEVEYMLKHGTSDNSYLVTVPGACALIDVPYEAYADKFVDALSSATRLSSITHVVVTHLDPKSIPTLQRVLKGMLAAGSKPTLVLSNPALRLLQSSLGEKEETKGLLSQVTLVGARSGQMLQLGSDAANALRLELTPTPRWPDLMVAYYEPSRVLFSSKLFSCHVSPPEGEVDDVGGWARYSEDWRYFFDCMLAPSARQAQAALDKLDLLPVPMPGSAEARGEESRKRMSSLVAPLKDQFAWLKVLITGRSGTPPPSASGATVVEDTDGGPMEVSLLAPMHGPAVGVALSQLLREYSSWAAAQIQASETANVVVLYASAYGNTAALAQAISRGVTKAGVGVTTLNLELASLDEVTEAVKQADGFILGSPTLGGHMPTQVTLALGAIMRDPQAKQVPCGVFGSFGWSGEAVDEMESRLKDAGFTFAFPAIRVKFKPTSKDVLVCEDSGRDLALAVKKKARARQVSAAPGVRAQAVANGAQLAAGRLVGSLAVLTAREEDATAAMLASWVSQASFEPPGITVAVKKDRAMEPLLQVGSQFAMSMLPEGLVERKVMKQLARQFAPSDDRLAGLDTEPGPLTQAAVLKDANAYVECQVAQRMEAGDHYVVYATVLGGDVRDESAPTAVHHRKVANHY